MPSKRDRSRVRHPGDVIAYHERELKQIGPDSIATLDRLLQLLADFDIPLQNFGKKVLDLEASLVRLLREVVPDAAVA
jgi:hypothetical protein